jgi:hypothetical protein
LEDSEQMLDVGSFCHLPHHRPVVVLGNWKDGVLRGVRGDVGVDNVVGLEVVGLLNQLLGFAPVAGVKENYLRTCPQRDC